MQARPYPKYRPSGVDWLGDVPEHWEAGNLRRYALMRTGHTPSRSEPDYWEDCEIPWFTLADVWQLREGRVCLGETKERISLVGLANSAAELLPAGTVVFSRTASVGFSGIMPTPMATTQDFWNWIPHPNLLSEYLLYTFRAMVQVFERLTMGSTHKTIYQPDAARLCIAVPPMDEQRAIARFLDDQTAKLDTLLAKKRALIERLREKRSALISRTVTRGLPPDAARAAGLDTDPALRPSGIDWLGEIPAHWSSGRIKHQARIESGHTPSRSIEEYWVDCAIPWVSLNDSGFLREHDYISDTAHKINEKGLANSSARLLPTKAVVFSRDATVGLCAITTVPMAVSQHFVGGAGRSGPYRAPGHVRHASRGAGPRASRPRPAPEATRAGCCSDTWSDGESATRNPAAGGTREMPRICTICNHPDHSAIDKAVVSQAPSRRLASLYGVSESAVRRHARSHLPKTLVKAAQVEAVANADDLLAQAQRLQREALGVLEVAKAEGNLGGVLQAIDRLQKGVALLATLAERGHESKEIVFRWSSCPHHTNEECPGRSGRPPPS